MGKNKINILNTLYSLEYKTKQEDDMLETRDGYTDTYRKRIIVVREKDFSDSWDKEAIEIYKKKVLRHEIIHAFLYESGLDVNSNKSYSWAENEEMVDWFAIQSPKLFEIYKKLNIL